MHDMKMTLQESERQKQAILDGCEDIIILFDTHLRVVWANRSVDRLVSDPVGMKCNQIFCRDSRRCVDCIITSSFKSLVTQKKIGKSIVTGVDNGDLFFRITTTPVKNTAGEIDKVVVFAQDITEKLRLEKQLRHASKMEAVGTLAGGIAHDFNNILTPIMGYSEIIRLNMRKQEFNREEATRYLDEILKASKRAKKLVEQVLTFSRSSEHKESLQFIHPIIKEGMKLIHATIPTSIQIIQDIDEDSGMVSVDPVEIHQILINLCTNAADAMAGKSGILKVSLKKSEKSADGEGWLELSVTDSGCGIEAELHERIFDPYFTTKEKEQGTGMGLAMVHGIISRQGGRISVDSKVNIGTTITLHLPVAKERTTIERIAYPMEFKGHGEHLLLVDDEIQVVASTAKMLRNLGYTVTEMTSSQEALLVFLKGVGNIDLVITDLSMPFMTGIELCEKIKERNPGVPVLLFTGYLDEYSRALALQTGINGFFFKPVSLEDMAKTIREAFGEDVVGHPG